MFVVMVDTITWMRFLEYHISYPCFGLVNSKLTFLLKLLICGGLV